MQNIHILPTDKSSRLVKNINSELKLTIQTLPKDDEIGCYPQHIYITSDEEIKNRNCWVTNGRDVFKPLDDYTLEYANRYWEKIILTTEVDLIKDGIQPIADEFLEWFVNNPSCEEVMTIKNYLSNDGQWKDVLLPSEWEIDTKIKYKIIPKEEPTILEEAKQRASNYMSLKGALEPLQETLEEAAKKEFPLIDTEWCRTGACEEENLHLLGHRKSFIKGAKWQQEQILDFLYSEVTERRDYSASKMCEKVIEFIRKS
jgi:hypothetical protein